MTPPRAKRFDPPLLMVGPLTKRVYIVTVGKDLGGDWIEATTKFDVTDQFDAVAEQCGWTRPDAFWEDEEESDEHVT